jgi:hypothetical protein
MSPCNIDKFVLSPLLTFLLMWHGKGNCHVNKSALSYQQKCDFADVVVTLQGDTLKFFFLQG